MSYRKIEVVFFSSFVCTFARMWTWLVHADGRSRVREMRQKRKEITWIRKSKTMTRNVINQFFLRLVAASATTLVMVYRFHILTFFVSLHWMVGILFVHFCFCVCLVVLFVVHSSLFVCLTLGFFSRFSSFHFNSSLCYTNKMPWESTKKD